MSTLARDAVPALGLPSGLHLATHRVDFSHILLAMDFSPVGFRALPAAAAWARLFGGQLYVLHALPEPLHGMMGAPDEGLDQAQTSFAEAQLQALAGQPALSGLHFINLLGHGSVPDLVCDAIQAHHIGLIVMAIHHAAGVDRLLRPSTTEAVLRRGHCPVLVVGPQASVPSAISSVLLATGLDLQTLRPAQFAAAIAEEMDADLTLFHAVGDVAGLPAEARDEVASQVAASLQSLLPADAGQWCRPNTRVGFGPAAAEILLAARETACDLLVVGVRDAGAVAGHLPWSTLSEVIRSAPCPVLAVPAHG